MNIKFAKMNPNAIIPSKRDEDAGYDIYACIDSDVVIKPGETKMIPTGLASAFDEGYVAILKERGSTGSRGMGLRCGVIDSGYRGQWFVAITNLNTVDLVISVGSGIKYENSIVYPAGKAIAQAVFFEIPNTSVEEISLEDLNSIVSKRGAGKLGSSNK